jgi:hypothetical protein
VFQNGGPRKDCQRGSVSVNSESGGPTDCQRVPSVSVCSAAWLANWRSKGTARRLCQCKFGTVRVSQVAVQKDCQEGIRKRRSKGLPEVSVSVSVCSHEVWRIGGPKGLPGGSVSVRFGAAGIFSSGGPRDCQESRLKLTKWRSKGLPESVCLCQCFRKVAVQEDCQEVLS